MPQAEHHGTVGGIVLAAGTSSRMGHNKLLLELEGESLLRRAVRVALTAGLEPVVAVLGHEAERVAAVLEGLPCKQAINPDYRAGIQTSAAVGINYLATRTSAAVIMLADMPFVTSEMVATLVQRYRQSTAPLVVSRYGDVNAPPILYDSSLFSELSTMRQGCGRQVVRRHKGEALTVSWPQSALRDIDVPDEYERLAAQITGI